MDALTKRRQMASCFKSSAPPPIVRPTSLRISACSVHKDATKTNDCHYRAAFWCACGGQSCVRYRDVPLSSGIFPFLFSLFSLFFLFSPFFFFSLLFSLLFLLFFYFSLVRILKLSLEHTLNNEDSYSYNINKIQD